MLAQQNASCAGLAAPAPHHQVKHSLCSSTVHLRPATTTHPTLPCRAYAFRSATEAQRKQRITRTYQLAPGAPPVGPAALAPPPAALASLPPLPPELLSKERLGWAPLELAGVPPPHLAPQLAALLSRCAIDHSVPSVAHMPGGSAAGYARWEAFRK